MYYKTFHLVTYLDRDQLIEAIGKTEKIACVLGWAAVLHDKDARPDGSPKVPHYHVVISLAEARRWDFLIRTAKGTRPIKAPFEGYLDDKNQLITTRVQVETNRGNPISSDFKDGPYTTTDSHDLWPWQVFEYMTHARFEGRAGYHVYPVEEFFGSSNFVTFFEKPVRNNNSRASIEMNIINALINEQPYRALVKEYGANFVYRYNQFKTMALAIASQEGEKCYVPCDCQSYEVVDLKTATQNPKLVYFARFYSIFGPYRVAYLNNHVNHTIEFDADGYPIVIDGMPVLKGDRSDV